MFLFRGAEFLYLAVLSAHSVAADDDLSFVQMQQVVSQQSQKDDDAQFKHEFGVPCTSGEVYSSEIGSYCLIDGEGYDGVNGRLKEGTYYEEHTHLAIENYLASTGSTGDIITGGLYIGDYLPHFSALAAPGTRVYGFEPDPNNYFLSLGTIKESGLRNIWTMKAGVGNATGEFPITVSPGVTEQAMIVRLDDVLPIGRKVAVLLLDVEGFELDALYGSIEILKRWHPLVVVETGSVEQVNEDSDALAEAQRAKEIYAFMKSLGYIVHLELPLEWNTLFAWPTEHGQVSPVEQRPAGFFR